MSTFDLNGAAERLDAWLRAPRDPGHDHGVPKLKSNIAVEQADVASDRDLVGFYPSAEAPEPTGNDWILAERTVEVRE